MHPDNEEYLVRHIQTTSINIEQEIDNLLTLCVPPNSKNQSLYRAMLSTIIRMAEADRNRWDAKIMMQTLREMEHAFSVLEQFKRRRKVTVFGSARTNKEHPLYQLAHSVGAQLAQHSLMTVTGAGGGIMAAAHEGAGFEYSLGLNIALPFEQHANTVVDGTDHLLSFHFFFLRKLFFVKEADAVVLFPGGFGTLDEALEVLTLVQTGKSPIVPIILVDLENGTYWKEALQFIKYQLEDPHYIQASDMNLMRLVHRAEDVVSEISTFYGNYHSSRWLKDQFVIRMNYALHEDALKELQDKFSSLCITDSFVQQPYCEKDAEEQEFCHLIRLGFNFNGKDQGQLRTLIDFINCPTHWLKNQAGSHGASKY